MAYFVFGFGIEFLQNKNIAMFLNFMVNDFITRYGYHMLISPISTYWYHRSGTGCIACNRE